MMMGLPMSTMGVSTGGVGRIFGAGGWSGATLPSRRVRRDWMASISSGGASWTPAMVNGGSESCCGISDSVGGCYPRDWEDMIFEPEHVSDPLTACDGHENSNASIVICSM
jgi:hypothetical protein